MTDSSYT